MLREIVSKAEPQDAATGYSGQVLQTGQPVIVSATSLVQSRPALNCCFGRTSIKLALRVCCVSSTWSGAGDGTLHSCATAVDSSSASMIKPSCKN